MPFCVSTKTDLFGLTRQAEQRLVLFIEMEIGRGGGGGEEGTRKEETHVPCIHMYIYRADLLLIMHKSMSRVAVFLLFPKTDCTSLTILICLFCNKRGCDGRKRGYIYIIWQLSVLLNNSHAPHHDNARTVVACLCPWQYSDPSSTPSLAAFTYLSVTNPLQFQSLFFKKKN